MKYLVAVANAIMSRGASRLASPFDNVELEPKFEWVRDVANAIYGLLWPILIIVAAAGTIYAVVLGVNMARADSTEKREEAKKRLINVVIGLAVIIVLIVLMIFFISSILPEFLKDKTPTA